MTHQQILDKLAAKHLVQSIDEDLARLTFEAMCFDKNNYIDNQFNYIFPKLMLRWNCILNASKENVTEIYRQKTEIALCVQLHKYGFADKSLVAQSLKAIDDLNKAVVLSDDFFRKSDEIKSMISSMPIQLKRKPTIPESITFYRPQDVVSFQLDNKFYAAYIHELTGVNESPILEFYNGIFDKVPTMKELDKLTAIGQVYNDGIERVSHYSVSGMKFLPDLANQVQLISTCVEKQPSNGHLKKPDWTSTSSDLFKIQETIKQIFNHSA
ncbi:MAG: hypothetical protein IT249_07930 [Chitinophagaceae bacterium]|nr:hypothetical protein [Chitinophagaceae bacterium]